MIGIQRAVDLGHATPGQVVTWPVAFPLTCGGTTHAAPGDIIQLVPGSRSAVFGGAISATSTTIGPVPADTVFYKTKQGMYDLTIALYHDQGLGAVKLLGVERARSLASAGSAPCTPLSGQIC